MSKPPTAKQVRAQIERINLFFEPPDGDSRYHGLVAIAVKHLSLRGARDPRTMAPDLVHNVVRQLLLPDPLAKGRRNIPLKVNLEVGLTNTVRSAASNMFTSASYNKVRNVPTPVSHDLASVFDIVPQFWDEADTANDDEKKRRERRLKSFYQFVADLPKTAANEQVYQIICTFRDEEISQRSTIAVRLGITPKAVTSAYRRLDTIIMKFMAKPESDADEI